jgi:trimeric autotransporter adhesin
MQRLLTLVFLLGLAVPAGISISGCTRNPAGNYCNGAGYGLKLTDVASIDLEPRTTGISLAFGQTQQIASPTAKTCKGTSATVTSYAYGTSNNQLVDLSPTGNICAGTWNRRSGGGIPDYTICNKPSPVPSTNGQPYANAFVTATAQGISSNQVEIFVHPQVTSVSLVLESLGTTTPFTGCLSQTQTAQLDAEAFYSNNGTQTLLCSPNSTAVPSCSQAIGNLAYASQNSSIATIDQFGVITAVLPGTTYITASVAGSGSSAGYFSTCPPASISVTLNNGQTSGTVTQGVTQNLVTNIVDTKGNTIQGLTLDYQSTNPINISAGSGGSITANFAGQADIYAVCQPTTCNPAPIDKIGVNLTGAAITSNPVTITTPGLASSFIWMASPVSPSNPGLPTLPGLPPSAGSQYFVPVQLITGSVGSPVKMPYVPNTMVLDKTGTSLYFGSSHELMIYSTSSNSLSKEDPNVPGVVLAAAPDNQTILINDPLRKLFYLYKPASGSFTTFAGVGTAAQWTPDAKTLYVVGSDPSGAPTLFVNNINTGWTTYPLPSASSNVAITIPSVAAFLSGQTTVAHAWCPQVTPNSSGSTLVEAYPLAAMANAQTDVLAATTDGAHILGVGLNGTTPELTDINVNVFSSLKAGACPTDTAGDTILPVTLPTPFVQTPLPFQASQLDQIVAALGSNLAFVTYAASGTGTATLPYYQPTASGSVGTVGQVTLTGTPTAPVAGAFSLDNTMFFVSTSGDNQVHYIDVKSLTDTKQIKPGLVDANGNPLPATVIVAKPRATT